MATPNKMSRNEKLRHDRLTFYKDDIEQIDKLLAEFLRLSGAKCALLIDKEGHLVTKRAELRTFHIDTIIRIATARMTTPVSSCISQRRRG